MQRENLLFSRRVKKLESLQLLQAQGFEKRNHPTFCKTASFARSVDTVVLDVMIVFSIVLFAR